ncbi:MAG: hydrogenase formation protein HypD [Myxococcales bacterium]|nr:hydrogenase formation protein HypD [Myxococcales bacterium]
MRFVDEYRHEHSVVRLAEALRRTVTRDWTVMEVCGGQTHAIVRFGIDALLPERLQLLHGPGCPVCVTPVELIDKAIALAMRPEVVLCSFGDMLRVPGSRDSLMTARARGADVRIVYSPLDALRLATELPGREVVFFAVGFETTAPTTAMAVYQARQRGVHNFSLLVSHVLVPPALEAILSSPERRVDGFLAAGHVCTIMGTAQYEPIARQHRVPIVVTGFEPLDILQGLYMVVRQLEEGRAEVENQYSRAVMPGGNRRAQEIIEEVFCVVPRSWRGIGSLPQSGLGLRPDYAAFDAERRFALEASGVQEDKECQSGLVLMGRLRPVDCPAFGTRCTPEHPLGATMVSSEGACAAYYRYRRA